MRRFLLCAAAMATSASFIAAANAQGRPQIILYQEDNFRGAQLALGGDAPRIKQMHFDDRASSVRVLSGVWELCSDDVFKGRCITVSRDEPRLDRLGMDDAISSVRLVSRGDDRRDRRDDRRDNRDNRRDR
jgi:hypothetical protein